MVVQEIMNVVQMRNVVDQLVDVPTNVLRL
jgi:hypothetical protein